MDDDYQVSVFGDPEQLRVTVTPTKDKGDADPNQESGFDTTITSVPKGFYVTLQGQKSLNVRFVAKALRSFCDDMVKRMERELHHAEFILSNDAETVKKIGLSHDCHLCRASTDQALAQLKANPTEELVLGTLYWAKP